MHGPNPSPAIRISGSLPALVDSRSRSSYKRCLSERPVDERDRIRRVAIPSIPLGRSGAPLLAASLLALLTVYVFRRQLLDGWTFPWDFWGAYSMMPAFVAATIGRGHLFAWTPFVASGFPADVDPQAGVYFPLWWLLGALHVPLTLGAVTNVQVFHVLFGGIGATLLARARRISWLYATVAGVAYVFFGGFYGEAEHADIFRGFAYIPWLLWALTPCEEGRRWARLAAVPLLAWLIATGAYPAQIISFGVAGVAYVTVALRVDAPGAWRRHRIALGLALVASIALCMAVLLPYLRAQQAGELFRASQPTAVVRATFALAPLDVFGLYLNNFAWAYEGTVTAWWIGIPVLIGVACARRATFASQAPLVACGAVALALGMGPKIGFVGRAMVSVGVLFPSRLPASDYKSVVALALIVIAADSWGRVSSDRRRPWAAVGLAACALVGGIELAPHTYAQPTLHPWMALGVIAAAGALALARPSPRALGCVLIALVVLDGMRGANDYLLAGSASPWQWRPRPSVQALIGKRDRYARELPAAFERAPAARPARVPAAGMAQVNAIGWLAPAYFVSDYNPTSERVLLQAERNPAWLRMLLAPWHAFTFPCTAVGCSTGAVHLPPPSAWHVSAGVQTISYGAEQITYYVDLPEPELMVENELAIAGWHANTSRVRIVGSGTPLRAWRLSPGTYEFVASFHEPGRTAQEGAAGLALIAWLGCVLSVARTGWRVRPRARDGTPP